MTNEVCFFDFQVENHQISNTEKRHGLNSASAKHLIHRQILECPLFITPEEKEHYLFMSIDEIKHNLCYKCYIQTSICFYNVCSQKLVKYFS